ncbi:MAG: hypothetical protein M3Y87_15655 [Myxococcota bacterium]|nr:hypothetical protein [Myxococcota bacterium]
MRIRRALLVPLLMTFVGCVADPSAGITGAPGPAPVPIGGDGGTECAHPEQGCACEPGRPSIDCYLDPIAGEDGSLTCNAGTRYCRDGAWTACEALRAFVIPAGPAALITGPDPCNPCDPRCFVSRDTPTPTDLPGRSSGVSYDTTRGGIELTPLPPMPEMLTDTDGDGVPDVADECVGPGAFRAADGSCYGDRFLFHTLPYGAAATDSLDISTQIRSADIYFLMDTTGSMGGELTRLKTDLTTGSFAPGCGGGIMGAIRCTMPDSWFGVGYFDDYPVYPYGSRVDQVYRNVRDVGPDLAGAQAAANSLALHSGGDGPESNTQALWAVASGGGLGSYLSARTTCAAGRWGYPCFRDGTIPIVIHITDAPFHNGPGGAYPYGGTLPVTWTQTLAALTARNVRVITVQTCGDWSSGYCLEGESHARSLGNGTGSLRSSGTPYVFRGSNTGVGLSSTIVDAVIDLANFSRMNITARAAGDTAGFTRLPISAISWGVGSCTGISGGTTFVQCLPGTQVNFRVTFRNDVVMPTMTTQVFTFFIEIVGDGTVVLARVPVRIVVPANVASYPASGTYWREYDSTLRCAINERPDWNSLSWSADIPAGTRIEFELRAANTAAALATATPIARIVTPTAVSPRDIATTLRAAGYPDGMQHLRITAVLHANTARTASPALRSMEVSYDCLPSE